MDNETKEKLKKFYNDPDWQLVVKMFEDKLKDLRDISKIDAKKSNDEIASEVRGRQISIESLSTFLRDSKIVSAQDITSNPTSFK